MSNVTLSQQDLNKMEDRKRARLVNSLAGFKSANLIGTCNKDGKENLSVVSSVIHMGSNPPLLAFVSRPATTRRDTLDNIMQNGLFTINAISADFVTQAHQTSARYPQQTSEFEVVGLTPYYQDDFPCPFVLESALRIGLRLKEHIPIASNNTQMVIGEVETIAAPERAMMPDGYLDIESLDFVTISGLDSYHVTQRVHRLSYAKPDKALFPLTREGEPTSWDAFEFE